MSFICIHIGEQLIRRAQKIRAERDKQYGNIYEEEESDLRWVGDLGEICFNSWLKKNDIKGFHWHLDNVAGKPDFTISGAKIDVKTVKRKVPPKPDYTAQITARHKDTPVDQLFFCSFEHESNKMWLLGGISKKAFLQEATYFGPGDAVHAHYRIRKGHEIYNAPISILINPIDWVKGLK